MNNIYTDKLNRKLNTETVTQCSICIRVGEPLLGAQIVKVSV